jgi:hypothetical protein
MNGCKLHRNGSLEGVWQAPSGKYLSNDTLPLSDIPQFERIAITYQDHSTKLGELWLGKLGVLLDKQERVRPRFLNDG